MLQELRAVLVSVGRMGWGREFKGRQVAFQSYVVQPDFLRVMGIPITDGRDFLESDFDKELGTMIFNEAARREFEMQVGDRINGFRVARRASVSFCADFNFKPLHTVIALLFLSSSEENPAGKLLAPASCGLCADDARSRYCGCYRPYPPLLSRRSIPHGGQAISSSVFSTRSWASVYDNERKRRPSSGCSRCWAVVIALLMGVFGLVLFETQHRRREIAVRRVMAGQAKSLAMFNRRYVMLVAVFLC